MTIEEIKDELYRLLSDCVNCGFHILRSDTQKDRYKYAVDMAIKSLEAWEKVRAEIEKESEVKTLQLHWGEAMGLNKAIEIIDKHISELRGDTDESSN